MGKLLPQDGGCWFCSTDDDISGWYLSLEFDSYVHKICLLEALKNEDNLEAKIIARELGLE